MPARLDRADGDVHAAGNPHLHLDPRNIAAVGAGLARRLADLDGANAAWYAARQKTFAEKWTAAMQGWEAKAAPLRGVAVVVYHKDWVYLENWLGLKQVATIEPKPGVAPGAAYLAQLLQDVPARGVKLILYAAYQEARAAQFVAEKSGVPAVMLPFTVGGTERATDLYGLFDDSINRLLAGVGTTR